MKKNLLFLLLLVPILSFARLTIVGIAFSDDDILFSYRFQSTIRKALLEANGKEWFMKHIIYANPDSTEINLDFIAGDYCIASDICESIARRSEFFDGVNKALDYLSEKNDTLYYPYMSDRWKKYPLAGIKRIKTTPEIPPENIYDFNCFYCIDRKNVDYIRFPVILHVRNDISDDWIRPFYPEECHEIFIKKYGYRVNKDGKNVYIKSDGHYNLIDNHEDAEIFFEFIKALDDTVTSMPVPKGSKTIPMHPFGYNPGNKAVLQLSFGK